MKNHWTKYLPEAGTVIKQGEQQMHTLIRIKSLQEQIDSLRTEYNNNEKELHTLVLKDWTWDEIDEAKAESIMTQLTHDERQARLLGLTDVNL